MVLRFNSVISLIRASNIDGYISDDGWLHQLLAEETSHTLSKFLGSVSSAPSIDPEDPMRDYLLQKRKEEKGKSKSSKKRKHDGETPEERRARKERKRAKKEAKTRGQDDSKSHRHRIEDRAGDIERVGPHHRRLSNSPPRRPNRSPSPFRERVRSSKRSPSRTPPKRSNGSRLNRSPVHPIDGRNAGNRGPQDDSIPHMDRQRDNQSSHNDHRRRDHAYEAGRDRDRSEKRDSTTWNDRGRRNHARHSRSTTPPTR